MSIVDAIKLGTLPAIFEVWATHEGVKDLTCIGFLVMYVLLAWALMRFLTADVSGEEDTMQLSFGWDEVKGHQVFKDVQPHVLEAFWRFHLDNPKVWELLHRFTMEALESGHAHYGIAAIFERIRWHLNVETVGEEFKLNNNYRSCYARLMQIRNPELGSLFQTRSSPAGA